VAAAPSKPSKSNAPAGPGALDTFKYKHTPEDAENIAAEVLPSSILTDLGDANWKTRLAGLDEMSSWLEPLLETLDAEVVVRALAKKGWGEKNFQVSFGMFHDSISLVFARFPPSYTASSNFWPRNVHHSVDLAQHFVWHT